MYYAALREHKDNIEDWDLNTFYEYEKIRGWKQAYLTDASYPVTEEMLVKVAIATLYMKKWDRQFNQAMREKYAKK